MASVFWVKWVIVGWSGVLVVRVGVMGALSGLGFLWGVGFWLRVLWFWPRVLWLSVFACLGVSCGMVHSPGVVLVWWSGLGLG